MSEVSKVYGDPTVLTLHDKRVGNADDKSTQIFEKKVVQEQPTESQIERAIGSVVDEYV